MSISQQREEKESGYSRNYIHKIRAGEGGTLRCGKPDQAPETSGKDKYSELPTSNP